MAASTGPDENTYQIDNVELGDTFNVWRDTTNTQTYKLNKMRIYDGISSDSIDVGISASGVFTADIRTNVNKGITFLQPVNFSSGVTFNGPVTFNADTFTVNASIVTIDDYAIVLGNTAAGSDDSKITAAGGGGLLIDRGSSGATAEWLWTPTQVAGLTGTWKGNAHIGFDGDTYGIIPYNNGNLIIHGYGLEFNGGITSAHGLMFTVNDINGTTSNRSIEFSRYYPAGATVFAEVLSGATYGARPFMNIKDGANRKTVRQISHGLQFGMPVRLNGATYASAIATDGQNAEVVGLVSKVIGSHDFELTFLGEIFGDFTPINDGQPLIPGTTYYLSPYVAGNLTSSQPTASGVVHKAVLIATSATSGVVLPFTGGVLSSPLVLSNATSVSTRINQANKFSLGDMVRFKPYSPGVTLSYIYNSSGNTYAEYHDYGIFVKAQADSEEEAEVAGMVVGFAGETGESGYKTYTGFDVLMDGFFDLSSAGSTFALNAGSVYFLNTGCAGSTGSFESGAACQTLNPPVAFGRIRKPLFMATGPKSGYLFSYRGDIRAEVGITGASADVTRFLVTDIRDGFSGDLVIGHYDGNQYGKESIRVAAGTTYYSDTRGRTGTLVGIGGGWSRYITDAAAGSARIMAQLDVNGDLRLGKTLAGTPQGQDLITVRNDTDTINGVTIASRIVIGTDYSDANLVIGRGVRPRVGAVGYMSSLNGTLDRSVFVLGVSGTSPMLRWGIANDSAGNLGDTVSMSDVFTITGFTASFAHAVNIGTTTDIASLATHKPRLLIQGDTNTSPRPQIYMKATDGNFILMNASGQTGDYNGVNQYGGGAYLIFGKQGGGGVTQAFGLGPWAAAGGQQVGMLMNYNGTTVNIGINKHNPTTTLDVNGKIKTTDLEVTGTTTIYGGGAPAIGDRLVASATNGTVEWDTDLISGGTVYSVKINTNSPATDTTRGWTDSLSGTTVYTGDFTDLTAVYSSYSVTIPRGVYFVQPYNNITYSTNFRASAAYYGRVGIQAVSGTLAVQTFPGKNIHFNFNASGSKHNSDLYSPEVYEMVPFIMWVTSPTATVKGVIKHMFGGTISVVGGANLGMSYSIVRIC